MGKCVYYIHTDISSDENFIPVKIQSCLSRVKISRLSIDQFTVVSLVAWPLNESEAGGDLVLIETSLLFYVNDAVLMLISMNLHNKRSEVSIITRSPPTSLSFKGRVTRHSTVKRSIN